MAYEMLSDTEMNDLRILLLEFFSGSSKPFPEMLADKGFEPYLEKMGEAKLRDFLLGLCDPAGFIFYSGSTRSRQYRTTKQGRAMLLIYKGEAQLPDPDAD